MNTAILLFFQALAIEVYFAEQQAPIHEEIGPLPQETIQKLLDWVQNETEEDMSVFYTDDYS